MIDLTVAQLSFTLIILTICVGMLAYMIGYFMGNEDEKKKVIDFHETHQMTLTEELIKTLYPLYPLTKNLRKP